MRAKAWRDIYLSWLSQTATGALTWAQTLVAGSNTGGSDPTIDVGDRLFFEGTREAGPTASVQINESIATSPVLDVASANFVGQNPNVSTSLRFQTGSVTASAPGTGATSGLFQAFTGAALDGAGNAGGTGQVILSTGAITSAAGSASSGSVLLGTGAVTGGSRRSGNAQILTGFSSTSGRTGDIDTGTGNNTGNGDTGYWSATTGNSTNGTSGGFDFLTGDGQQAGSIRATIGTSNGAAANGGDITLSAGAAPSGLLGGNVELLSGSGASGQGRIEFGQPNAAFGVGQQAEQVFAPYLEWSVEGFQTRPGRAVWQKKITTRVATVAVMVSDDPDFELQTNAMGSAASSTSGLVQITSSGANGDFAVVRTDQTAFSSSWGKANLSRGTRYLVAGTIEMTVLAGRYEVGARPTTNAFDNVTDDNKTILVYDPSVSANWQAVTSNAGADFVDDTGIPAIGGGALNYVIRINDNNQVEYWMTNAARGGRLELVVVRGVGIALSGCIMYAGCITTSAPAVPQFGWGNPIQAVNL